MLSQPLQLSQWAVSTAAVAAALLGLFVAYLLARRRRQRPLRKRRGPHSALPSSLEYEIELTWRG
jgi:membrane protein DedA with SNARE-associated domain